MKEKLLIFKEKNISLKSTISILLLLGILSSIFGFLYETFFYRIDLGFYVKRGSTFGPWIPIYFFGGVLIVLFTYALRKKPFVVFLTNCVVTGLLEFLTGLVLDKVFDLRLWDYNTEIWNFGNINGYLCLRSVLFFGVSSLLLIYAVTPILLKIYDKISEKKFHTLSFIITGIFVLDIILHFFILGF